MSMQVQDVNITQKEKKCLNIYFDQKEQIDTSEEKQCRKGLGEKVKARSLACMKYVASLTSDWPQLKEKPPKKV